VASESAQSKTIMMIALVFIAVVAVLFSLHPEGNGGNRPGSFDLNESVEDITAENLQAQLEEGIRDLEEDATAMRIGAASQLMLTVEEEVTRGSLLALDPALLVRLKDALSKASADPNEQVRKMCTKTLDIIATAESARTPVTPPIP